MALVARRIGLACPVSGSRTRKFPALPRLPRSCYPSLLALRLTDALGCLPGPDLIGRVAFLVNIMSLTTSNLLICSSTATLTSCYYEKAL
jgi:hypothetical protein